MGVSYKYFVTCIVAIFLALGIGMLAGFMIDGESFVQKEQVKIIDQAQQKFDNLSEANTKLVKEKNELSNKIKNLTKYGENMNDELLPNRLLGMRIAIIETTGNYMYTNMIKSLQKAGVQITNYIVIKSSITNNNALIEEKVKKYLDENNIEYDKNYYEVFFKLIAEAVANGNDKEVLEEAKDIGLIQINVKTVKPADYVILAGGSETEDYTTDELIDKPIIEKLKDDDIKVVGVEQSNAVYSYISTYKKEGISTVDNMESPIGNLSLCMVLQGKEGRYGERSGSSSLMPSGFTQNFKVVNRLVPTPKPEDTPEPAISTP